MGSKKTKRSGDSDVSPIRIAKAVCNLFPYYPCEIRITYII